jgi:hypothetical protein
MDEVAHRLGVPRGSVHGLVQRCKIVAQPLPRQYTPPILPDEDEPLDDVIARMEREQERQQAYAAATEWMRYTVQGDEPFCLAFVGDPHMDVCDIKRLRRHVELIRNTDRMWAVGLGDWLNSWVGRLKANYAGQAVTERDGLRLARWLLEQDIWWLLLLGNHDGLRWHGQMNPLRWMENAAPVPVQDWQAKFSVECAGRVWKVWAAHNFPGNSQFNAAHGPQKRALMTGAEADVYVAGDRHTFALQQHQHEHTGRVYWTLRARGYKPLDDYAREHGHGPAGGERGIGHTVAAVFDPRNGRVTCFAELEDAAAFLMVQRMRRAA